jgi:hypothetical protein
VPVYEYLVLIRIYKTSWEREVIDGPFGKTRQKQTWTTTYEVWRPDATEAQERSGDLPLTVLLNELGREGWRLVASEIPDSVVVSGRYGWPEAGIPIRQRWTFMREVSS